MCAIIGYATQGESDVGLLKRLFTESKIRGLHAFGYSFRNGGNLVTRKFHSVSDVCAQLEWDRPKALIGHCRYSTSGDFREHLNNQPIVRHGGALVFNGVIDMGTKAEMEREWGVTLESDNDGELVLASDLSVSDFVNSMVGSFAGLLLDDNGITAIRNARRPAWCVRTGESTVVASTLNILRRSGIQESAEELVPLVPYKIA